jgi:UDP-N-acetylglucosamine 1-carboxyvinyltransferase
MEKFLITGGQPLAGKWIPGGNKNEALPVLAAALLTSEEVILQNLPRISDVEVMLKILVDLGAEVEWLDRNRLSIKAENIKKTEVDRDLCQQVRASILFAGAMLGRFGRVVLPPPGGDVIGRRRLDTHILGFESLGAESSYEKEFEFKAGALIGADIFLDEASVTATENIIMAAVLASGETIIRNAAAEPHVQGLCSMLNSMGAKISGVGTHTLTITGVKRLGGTTHRIGPDYLEIGSVLGLAAVMGHGVSIVGVRASELRKILMVFEKLGVSFELSGDKIFVPGPQKLAIKNDLMNEIPKIDDAIWPAFPTDLMSIVITVATQAEGAVLFFEKMFDGRMFFTDHLISMGARIILCDPHRIVVLGATELVGQRLESPDVRAGMALLIAALCARGESTIYNIKQIDRGYEEIENKLKKLGASIERLTA